MPIKICTIGCGNHSTQVHGPSYLAYKQKRPDAVFAACCDLDISRAEAYRKRFGFERAYADMNEMLNAERPDAVCVIVPEHLVCDTSINVMKMGYPILLEKPPGLSKTETKQMISVAKEQDVINQVAFNRRFLPLIKKLKDEIHLHAEGNIQTLFYEFYRYNRREPSFETTAIHGIDAAKYIIGCDYKEVRFTYQDIPGAGEKVCNILLDCVFVNGVVARLNFCPVTGAVLERICVTAKDHTFFLSTPIWDGMDSPGMYQHVHACKVIHTVSGTALTDTQEMFKTNGFSDENFSFFEHVAAGIKCDEDIASTLQSVEIAEAIRLRLPYWKAQ